MSPGTNSANGLWDQGQVEHWLRQELKLIELKLTTEGNGAFTGEGRDAANKSFRLKVSQVPGGIACDFATGPGSSGRIAFGSTVPPADAPAPTLLQSSNQSGITIASTPVSGSLHGRVFKAERATLDNGVLSLRMGRDPQPDLALDIMLWIQQGESPERKTITIAPNQSGGKPIVRVQWREPGKTDLETEHHTTNYELVIKMDQAEGNRLPGRLYLRLPDSSGSTVSGTFVIER